MQQANIARVAKDFGKLHSPKDGIYAKMVDDRLDRFYMMLVGPKDSPYEGALFFFTIEPNTQFTPSQDGRIYPFNPPKVVHYAPYSIRIHPNLYKPDGGGKVCLSILGTWAGPGWTALMTFSIIAQTILSILDNEPLRNEPGYVNSKGPEVQEYTDYVRYVCTRETVERVFNEALSSKSDDKLPNLGVSSYYGTGSKPPDIPFYKIFRKEIQEIAFRDCDLYVARFKTLHARFLGKKVHSTVYGDTHYQNEPYKYQDLVDKIKSLVTEARHKEDAALGEKLKCSIKEEPKKSSGLP